MHVLREMKRRALRNGFSCSPLFVSELIIKKLVEHFVVF